MSDYYQRQHMRLVLNKAVNENRYDLGHAHFRVSSRVIGRQRIRRRQCVRHLRLTQVTFH